MLLSRLNRMRIVFKLVLFVLLFVWLVIPSYQAFTRFQQKSIQKCYLDKNLVDKVTLKTVDMFKDVSIDSRQPRPDQSIFFHETTCLSGYVELDARKACAIESAAIANPDKDVFVLFASPVGIPLVTHPNRFVVELLAKHPNVIMRNVILWKYSRNTPANEWINDEYPQLFSSDNSQLEMTYLLCLISLYKYGGTCMDLDLVIKKSMDDKGKNFVALDSNHNPLFSVFRLNSSGNGHAMADFILREFIQHYSEVPKTDSNRAERSLHQITHRVCGLHIKEAIIPMNCSVFNLNVLSSTAFYPVDANDWPVLFNERHATFALEASVDSLAVRFWSQHSANRFIHFEHEHIDQLTSEEQPLYVSLAKEFCPNTFKLSNRYF